ncbi:hypothetical protein [Flavobacterium sp. LT1R49]|uniref:hypothetical protein n=1 Tax=Flavobacterium arabinosi TaxID=3398737 RepID=UPI003A8BA3DA
MKVYIFELSNQGYSVYVDWIIDPELDRNNITKKSATLIRSRLIPMSKSDYTPNSYVEVEYLSLYPFIKKIKTRGLGEKLFVIEET